MNEHTQNATKHLQKAKKELAVSDNPEAYAKVSSLKRNLEIEESDN